MSKQFVTIILVNVVLILLFSFMNYGEWTLLNADNALGIRSQWSPVTITINTLRPYAEVVLFPNYSFAIFLISTIINIIFLRKVQKSKEMRPA